MAVFLLKSEHGSALPPPACTGSSPTCLPVASSPTGSSSSRPRAITGGCGGGNYCPNNPNTRGQMAVFLVKTFGLLLYGP